MMTDALPFDGRDLVRTDIEAAIDSRRIATDDFTVVPERECNGEGAFPGGCRSQNRENRRPQTLHPEKGQRADQREKNQKAKLLCARRHQYPGGGFSL